VTRDIILIVGLLLAAGLCARVLAELTRVPELLYLLAAGVVLGPSGLDALDADLRSQGAQLIFTLGVSAILFHGGLSLSLDVLRRVWVTIGLLAVPGMILTAVVTGAVASLVLDLSFTEGLLIGAVLAPTDPAILIPLIVGSRLRPKVGQTVVAESAVNDPTGAILALAVAAALVSGDSSFGGPAGDFLAELAISSAIGVVAGVALAVAISSRRAGIWRESPAIAFLAVVALSYVSLDFAGGSGYLGAFIAGLIVGNMDVLGLSMHEHHEQELRQSSTTLADVVTIFVFVVLGANLPFGTIGDHLLPLLAVIAVLVLVARPLTVLACALPDRRAGWTRPELAFICWTRETGVVPAALVGVLAGLGAPNTELLAAAVAVAIVVTLVVQAAPARLLAGRLGLLDAAT
jgi:cell volume regulation protein A